MSVLSDDLTYVLDLKGSDVTSLKNSRNKKVVADAFAYWRRRGFPYCESNEEEFKRSYERLSRLRPEQIITRRNRIIINTLGLSLANYFHPQMWHIKVKDAYTPIERFHNDRALLRVLQHSIRMWPTRNVFSAINVRNAVRIYSKTRSPTNFRPSVAKAVIERYSRDGETVVDFSAGFGGRLLGCLSLDRYFVAIDPSKEQINGMRNMVTYCKDNFAVKAKVRLVQARAENFLTKLPTRSVSLIFTSPPYFNYESYGNGRTQSHVKYPTYKEWKECFLHVVVAESYRILKPGGRLVVNLKNIDKLFLADDFKKKAIELFSLETVLKMKIATRPYRGDKEKFEPVFVLRRV